MEVLVIDKNSFTVDNLTNVSAISWSVSQTQITGTKDGVASTYTYSNSNYMVRIIWN